MPAHDGVPGFMGATEIISSKELWNRWREGPKNRIDSKVFLRDRIVNLWTGNWDRHRSQWRWAWIPDRGLWVPIPEDPDQAFSDYGGWLISFARLTVPILLEFGDEISGMEGAVRNGADVDRWLLSDLGRDDFVEAAREVQSLLTDEVIDTAVGKLPPEWYALNGETLGQPVEEPQRQHPGSDGALLRLPRGRGQHPRHARGRGGPDPPVRRRRRGGDGGPGRRERQALLPAEVRPGGDPERQDLPPRGKRSSRVGGAREWPHHGAGARRCGRRHPGRLPERPDAVRRLQGQ